MRVPTRTRDEGTAAAASAVAGIGGACLHPSNDALDPGAQFAQVERLDDVIVSTDFKPGNAVRHLGGTGHHDDPDVVALAQEARERKAILSREVDVEQDDVRQALFDRLAHRRAAVRLLDLIAVRAEVLREHLAHGGVVLDD